MKFIITIVLTCVIFSLYAQEKYNDPLYPESNTVNATNFKIDNGSLVWQKIYESKLTPTAIVKKLKADGKIKNIDFSENLLTGELNIPADYKNAGFSQTLHSFFFTSFSSKKQRKRGLRLIYHSLIPQHYNLTLFISF